VQQVGVVYQQSRELGERKDEDQIEEQL